MNNIVAFAPRRPLTPVEWLTAVEEASAVRQQIRKRLAGLDDPVEQRRALRAAVVRLADIYQRTDNSAVGTWLAELMALQGRIKGAA